MVVLFPFRTATGGGIASKRESTRVSVGLRTNVNGFGSLMATTNTSTIASTIDAMVLVHFTVCFAATDFVFVQCFDGTLKSTV